MTIQVHVDMRGNFSAVQYDPYEWVEPFEAMQEAEDFAVQCAEIRRDCDEEVRRMREMHAQETAYLRRQLDGVMQAAMNFMALENKMPLILKELK